MEKLKANFQNVFKVSSIAVLFIAFMSFISSLAAKSYEDEVFDFIICILLVIVGILLVVSAFIKNEKFNLGAFIGIILFFTGMFASDIKTLIDASEKSNPYQIVELPCIIGMILDLGIIALFVVQIFVNNRELRLTLLGLLAGYILFMVVALFSIGFSHASAVFNISMFALIGLFVVSKFNFGFKK